MKQQELLLSAAEKVKENKQNLSEDPNRLQFHLMPPVGLLNDPNGLIQFNGTYHVFYQWNPFETAHGSKFWGHYTSEDLVHWQEQPPALTPSEWYEKNGCYSGSAVESEGKLFLFYTGNVKNEQNERETYQCLAVSDDGIHFEKMGPVIQLPEGYTAHFRDPKVWKDDGLWYMVLGAQTLNEEGCVVLYSSQDLKNWKYKGAIAGSGMNGLEDFGYMWECPDFFRLGNKDVLLVSPQGLEPKGHLYHNIFQSGYFIGEWKPGTTVFSHGDFVELDRGFDFYAPQTFEDQKGRRIMYAWMGITDEDEPFQPTIEHGWVHGLTLPRELKLKGDKLYQQPLPEMKKLRKAKTFDRKLTLEDENFSDPGLDGKVSELKVTFNGGNAEVVELTIRDHVKIRFNKSEQLFSLERGSFQNGKLEKRSCTLSALENMHIFLDTSSIEIFLNSGQETFTARFFTHPDNENLQLNIKGQAEMRVERWCLSLPE